MSGSSADAVPLGDGGGIFAIEVRSDASALVLVLRGELDLAGRPRFSAALEAALSSGEEHVVLELGRLSFMDGSSGALIARAQGQLRARDGALTLRHPQPQVRRLIELCAALAGPDEERDRPPARSTHRPRAEAAALAP